MMDPQVLEQMAAMMPPGVLSAIQTISTVIPNLAERVNRGLCTPAEAAAEGAISLEKIFREMKEAHLASQGSKAV